MKLSRFNIGFIKAHKETHGTMPDSDINQAVVDVTQEPAPTLPDVVSEPEVAPLSVVPDVVVEAPVEPVASPVVVPHIPAWEEDFSGSIDTAGLSQFHEEEEEESDFHPLDRDQDGDIDDDSFEGMAYPIKIDMDDMGEDFVEELARKLGKKHKVRAWHNKKLPNLLTELSSAGVVEWSGPDSDE
jgi:hypothetical protein